MSSNVFPICNRFNCFAHKDGHCVALSDNHFKNDKPCPFFKTNEQLAAEEAKCRARLESLGDVNMILKYRHVTLREEAKAV